MVRVKVCGLQEAQHALAAARLGADLLGLVFAPTRRQITVSQAKEIVDAVGEEFPIGSAGVSPARGRGLFADVGAGFKPAPTGGVQDEGFSQRKRPLLVGVFVNQPLDEVERVAASCGLDYVQLHGDEPTEYCRALARPFIKALRLGPEEGEEEMARRIDSYLAVSPEALFLLDTHLPGVYGGTGLPWEWQRAARLAQSYHILVAGGLTRENVTYVVRATRPWGVDVSSGVETDGVKDETKIRAFIEAVRDSEGGDDA